MIPESELELDEFETDFEEDEEPNLTYRLDFNSKTIVGTVDDADALAQALNKILLTETETYLIYSYGYGREFKDLYGKSTTETADELPERIEEAVLKDERFQSVDVTELTITDKHSIHVVVSATATTGEEIEVEEDIIV